jgi:hypothetical protein
VHVAILFVQKSVFSADGRKIVLEVCARVEAILVRFSIHLACEAPGFVDTLIDGSGIEHFVGLGAKWIVILPKFIKEMN